MNPFNFHAILPSPIIKTVRILWFINSKMDNLYVCNSSDSDDDVQISYQCNNTIPVIDDDSEGFSPNSPKLGVLAVDDLSMCMQQAQFWIEKARNISTEKENASGACKRVENMLLEECHKRDQVIQSLQRIIVQEQMNTMQQVNRLNRELQMMGKAIIFYKDQLQDVNGKFLEFRAINHVPLDHAVAFGDTLEDTRKARLKILQLENEKNIQQTISSSWTT
ncbi:hypothetical protein L6164_034718 [Bauhinia variegata]|uniref:Uncharacterized protein n=1 Tax=Bauhinia variegata TaxID=167791 RepID=A0ACB9KVZ9_BAUVA|nr:hypothetical protein L6164_034718 [Bauhinia variegata]